MGYVLQPVRFGWAYSLSDVLLYSEDTEESVIGTAWEEKKNFSVPLNISYTQLRFKVDLRTTVPPNSCECRIKKDGVTMFTVSEAGNVYVTKTQDDGYYNEGDIITVEIRTTLLGVQGFMRNFRVYGTLDKYNPFVEIPIW